MIKRKVVLEKKSDNDTESEKEFDEGQSGFIQMGKGQLELESPHKERGALSVIFVT